MKKPTVLIDSSNIIVKKFNLPEIAPKKLFEILKNEFDFSINRDDYIYDANMGMKKDSILCAALPIDFIGSYVSLFKEARIKIEKIDIAINVIAKYVTSNKILNSSTFILNMAKGKNLLSILFENGTFTYIDRSNLSSLDDVEEVTNELYSKMSQLIQFSKSRKSEHIIEKSYYIGLDEAVVQQLEEHTKRFETDISVEAFVDDNLSYQGYEFMYPMLALNNSKDDMNLYKVGRRNTQASIKKRVNRKKIFTRILIVLLLLAPIVAFGLYYYNDNQFFSNEISRIEAYLDDDETVRTMNQVNEEKREIVQISTKQKEIDRNLEEIEGSHIIEKNMLWMISSEAGEAIKVSGIFYSLDEGTITISASCTNEHEAANYIAKLRATEMFETVSYHGYEYNETSVEYLFSVSIALVGGQKNED